MSKQTQPPATELREALYHAELEVEGYVQALSVLEQLQPHMGDRRAAPYKAWRAALAALQDQGKLAQRDRRNVVRRLGIKDTPQAVQDTVVGAAP